MPVQSVSERLPFDMLKSISKSLDTNRNNRIDQHEVGFETYRALHEASRDANGYANDVVGTTEMARAMQRDAVSLRNLPPAVAERVAFALTRGDAWLSQSDFQLSDRARDRIDGNWDGRVSRRELSDALQDGTLEVGASLKMAVAPPPRYPW